MYTMKDVAKEANVSIGTVSNYINKTRPVQKKTAKRIQQAIDALHFSPNHAARILKTKDVKEIGVIIPHLYDPYYVVLLRGIEKALRAAEYDMNLVFSYEIPEEETKALQNMCRRNAAGVLLITCQPAQTEVFKHTLDANQIPSVFIHRIPNSYDANHISYDNYRTIGYLMNTLLEQNPKAKIGLMVGNRTFSSEQECVQSYMDTLEHHQLDAPSHYICYTNATKEDAFKASIYLLTKDKLDIILTSSEEIAAGIHEANVLLHKENSNELQIISFGEDHWMNTDSHDSIIKTNRMPHLMGQEAVTLLMKNMESPLLFEKQQIKLQDKIIDINRPIGKSIIKAAPKKIATLKIAMLKAPITDAMEHILSDFTYKTGISVELTHIPQEDLLEAILTDSRSNQGHYDIYMYDLPWLSQLAAGRCLMDLTPLINQSNFDTSVYIPNLLNHVGKHQNAYYGVPFLYSSQLLLYRKDLFRDPDLCKDYERKYAKPLQPPKTWLEFNAIAEFFTESLNPKSPVAYGTSIAGKTQEILVPEFLCRLWSYNGRLYNDQNKLQVDTPEFKRALNNFVDVCKFTHPHSLSHTIEDTVDEFLGGDTAMLITYSSYIHDLSNPNISKVIGKYQFNHLPRRQPLLGGWALGLSPHCDQPEEAFSWIRWACGTEISNYITVLEGQSPIKEVYFNDEMIHLYPWLPLVYKTQDKTNLRRSPQHPRKPVIPIDEIESVLFHYLRSALHEQCTADEAVIAIDSELKQLFKIYGY